MNSNNWKIVGHNDNKKYDLSKLSENELKG